MTIELSCVRRGDASGLSDRKASRRQRAIPVVIAALLVAFTIACGSSATSPTTVSTVAVTGTAPAIGATSQFTATATFMDGTSQDVTSQATWSSSNTSDATVSSIGLVTGVAAGTVAIQATYQNVIGSDQITVTP
jgi:uncharacterized protein YjdB